MKLQVAQLIVGETPFEFRSEKDVWFKALVERLGKQGYVLKSNVAVDAKLTKLEPDYYLQGRMVFKLDQNCSRCAEDFQLPIEHAFQIAFVHAVGGKKAKLSEESEELDLNLFEGPELDLAPVLEEQFVLSLPFKPLCKPDCKGVCQNCGKNWNQGPCQCKGTEELSPFAVLKKLKVD